jgi:predicted glycoside hydrolase/deacetylase ChbG (UPF0249 family)
VKAAPPILLIVNADDFGLSDGVNRGIIEAHERGIVTSASLMVRQAGAQRAADYARGRPQLGVGLHLDLGEWEFTNGSWHAVYQVVDPDDENAINAEFERQAREFIRLMGTAPTHIDSHQHVHRDAAARTAASRLATSLAVPLRHFSPAVHYCGDFYGQTGRGEPLHELISPEALGRIIAALSPGMTELACHPGVDPDLRSTYRIERKMEVRALCDPTVRAAIEDRQIRLCNFRNISGLAAVGLQATRFKVDGL